MPCLMERAVKESQSKAGLMSDWDFSKAAASGTTLERRRRRDVSALYLSDTN